MKKTLAFMAFPLVLALPTIASAGDDPACGNVPTAEWMSADAIKAKAVALGYTVRRVATEDGCYELYAIDKNGAKVELYMHPATGAVVTQKADD